MQFMILSRRRTELFGEDAYTPDALEAEAERVRALYIDAKVRQIWLRGDVRGACMIMEADSEDEVRALLASLPLFAAGKQETVAIVPLLPYRGFGPRA